MMNPESAPPPPLERHATPAPQPRHSGLGIASLIIGVLGGLAMFALFAVAGYMQISNPGGMDEKSGAVMMIGLGVIGFCLVHLLGLGLGIAALFQADRRKGYAVVGLVINTVIIAGTVGLIILGSAMK